VGFWDGSASPIFHPDYGLTKLPFFRLLSDPILAIQKGLFHIIEITKLLPIVIQIINGGFGEFFVPYRLRHRYQMCLN